MNYDDRSVDELIELGSIAVPGVFSQLSAITAGATADGVTVRVNLEGRLVELELAPSALSAGPATLADTIFRLTQEASATALNTGIEVLAPLAGEELTAELRSLTLPAPPAPTPPPAPPADDFAEVESWAIR